MKFLTVFAAILAVAFGAKAHWTLGELSEALQSPHTNPSLVPILEQALNSYMQALFDGESHEYISISTAPVDLSTWSLHELSSAIESPNTNPAILPYLENALNGLMNAIVAGEVQATTAQVSIQIPALEVSHWTLAELEQALANPATNPAMVPYLEQGLNHIVENLFNGVQQTSIVLAIPAEATKPVPVTPVVVAPEVVDPAQVVDHADAPVTPGVAAPAPAAPAPAPVAGSPLVQIILNINQQSVTPGAVIAPTPVIDNGEVFPNPRPPSPVNPRPPAPVNPRPPAPVNPRPPVPEVEVDPVIVTPEVNPIEVIAVSPPEVNPIEVIAVSPPEVNPIEVIAVSPPEVNPIEVIAVSPPEVNPIEVIAVSPPEVNPIEVIAVSPPEVNPIEVIAVSPPEVNPVEVIAVSPPEVNPIEVIAVSPPEVIVPEVVVGGGDIGPM